MDKPPVLLDIGASGSLPAHWKILASHSICIAFDADDRDFIIEESQKSNWKKLYTLNRLVTPESSENADFYLTRSPHCSSSLLPNKAALEPWAFQGLFDIEKTIKLQAIDLKTALKQIGLGHIDWYKTDSQGTDLRIFRSLPSKVMGNVLVADFEPGIIDAYAGEDKLHHLMAFMDQKPFWISDMEIKGSQRINSKAMQNLISVLQKKIGYFLKASPGWCEISYINKFESSNLSIREFLLGWVFATVKGQHGFALHLATLGESKFKDEFFSELEKYSHQRLYMGFPVGITKVWEIFFAKLLETRI
jgi:hypothetical protein